MQAAMQDIGLPGPKQETTHLLQMRASTRREMAAVPPELARVMPISWVHVPKSGASFINTIVHLPGVCPSVPKGVQGDAWADGFIEAFDVPRSCPGLHDREWGHAGLLARSGYEGMRGKFMIMLRQPEQRLISAYQDLLQAQKAGPAERLLDAGSPWGGWPGASPPGLRRWAASGGGCAVRMLTRRGLPCGGLDGPPAPQELELAKERLHTDFSFIGLTEHWDLSMCLFSAMFKVDCFAGQFEDAQAWRPDSRRYDESELNGMKDIYDGELYEEALQLFNARRREFNVTEEYCMETCWKQAGVAERRQNMTSLSETNLSLSN